MWSLDYARLLCPVANKPHCCHKCFGQTPSDSIKTVAIPSKRMQPRSLHFAPEARNRPTDSCQARPSAIPSRHMGARHCLSQGAHAGATAFRGRWLRRAFSTYLRCATERLGWRATGTSNKYPRTRKPHCANHTKTTHVESNGDRTELTSGHMFMAEQWFKGKGASYAKKGRPRLHTPPQQRNQGPSN